MSSSNILLLVGGTWHKFDAFADDIGNLLRSAGHRVVITRELSALHDLSKFDLVVMYTCYTKNKEDGTPADLIFRDEDAAPLAKWVAGGGKLLMLHAATLGCETSPMLRDLTGGSFVRHPPMFSFTVYPTHASHPIVAGISVFEVFDEFYIQDVNDDIAVHMVAIHEGQAHPMVWTRREGTGKVAYIAPGHDDRVWNLPPYRQMLTQAVTWLAANDSK